MSDDSYVIRQLKGIDRRLGQTEVKEVPPLYLPFAQRVLNPFPLASSGNHWGDTVQPWAANVLAFYVSVFVSTTNNGTNFWTLDLVDNVSGVVVASVVTSAIAANTWSRLSDITITQPATTCPSLGLRPTATLSPGAIYIVPAVALLRTG